MKILAGITKTKLVSSVALLALAFGCSGEKQESKERLEETLVNNPEILANVIKKNPMVFVEAIQVAVRDSQDQMAQKRIEEEERSFKESFNNPLKPLIREDEAIRGNKNGTLTLVEYVDFECVFCARGHLTIKELEKKYSGDLRIVTKHLPLNFHKEAMISAKYYEALRLQDEKKAFKFHDEVFQNQDKLKRGEAYLKKVAKDLGADMKKLEKDITSEAVELRIAQDLEEAARFGIQGTPGFILNGVPIKGAYPIEHFEKIIAELQKRNLVTLK